MSFRLTLERPKFACRPTLIRGLTTTLLMLALAACSSQAAREAEMAAVEAERVAVQQEAAEMVQADVRRRADELRMQRERARADIARLQAEQDRRSEAARARAMMEREQQEEAERRERQRVAEIAAVEAERQGKIDRISDLEQQIAGVQTSTAGNEVSNSALREAILVAEELLDLLALEQTKYDNTDAQGNTVEALATSLISELEARKDDLLGRALQ